MSPSGLLLDTCAVVWLVTGAPMARGAEARIVEAGRRNAIHVSPISAWEIGLLSRAKAGRGLAFLPDPATWFARLMARSGIVPAIFNAEIAIAASHLPEPLHGDLADRLLIATARHAGLPIMTRDSKIIAYADAGHVSVVAC